MAMPDELRADGEAWGVLAGTPHAQYMADYYENHPDADRTTPERWAVVVASIRALAGSRAQAVRDLIDINGLTFKGLKVVGTTEDLREVGYTLTSTWIGPTEELIVVVPDGEYELAREMSPDQLRSRYRTLTFSPKLMPDHARRKAARAVFTRKEK